MAIRKLVIRYDPENCGGAMEFNEDSGYLIDYLANEFDNAGIEVAMTEGFDESIPPDA